MGWKLFTVLWARMLKTHGKASPHSLHVQSSGKGAEKNQGFGDVVHKSGHVSSEQVLHSLHPWIPAQIVPASGKNNLPIVGSSWDNSQF